MHIRLNKGLEFNRNSLLKNNLKQIKLIQEYLPMGNKDMFNDKYI